MSQPPQSGRHPSVTRSKTMELARVGPEAYRLLGRLTDTSWHGDYGGEHGGAGGGPPNAVIHDFLVEGALQGTDLVITELAVAAETHPYRQCPAIVPSCQALVGRSLAGGWRRRMRSAVRLSSSAASASATLRVRPYRSAGQFDTQLDINSLI